MTELDHPILREPERKRAYDILRGSPTGTERAWAKQIGWKRARVQRFIAALVRQRLATATRTRYGTRIEFATRSIADPQPIHSQSIPDPKPIHLDTGEIARLDLGGSGEEGSDHGYAVQLIEVMNTELVRLLTGFKPVRSDNRGSHDAARRIRQAGVPLYRAIEVLRDDCRRFNPSKHGRGEYPHTLAYFQKGVLDRWRAEQTEITLLSVVRDHKESEAVKTPRGGKPVPLVEAMLKYGGERK